MGNQGQDNRQQGQDDPASRKTQQQGGESKGSRQQEQQGGADRGESPRTDDGVAKGDLDAGKIGSSSSNQGGNKSR